MAKKKQEVVETSEEIKEETLSDIGEYIGKKIDNETITRVSIETINSIDYYKVVALSGQTFLYTIQDFLNKVG